MVKYIDNHLSMAQGWHTDARQENTGWKWPKFHITANCKITIANFLTNHCANMIFHEQLNISIYKSTNYYEVCISHGSKVMAKVKVFFLPQSQRQTCSQTDRTKTRCPEFHSGEYSIHIF